MEFAIELSRHKLTNWLYIHRVELAAKTNSGQRRRSFPAYSYLTGHYSTSYRYCFDLSPEAPRNLAEPLVTSWYSCFRAPRLPIYIHIYWESNASQTIDDPPFWGERIFHSWNIKLKQRFSSVHAEWKMSELLCCFTFARTQKFTRW